MIRILTIGFLLIPILFIFGCSLHATKEEKTAEELVNIGMREFNKKKYRQAIKSFDQLREWYPFSTYSIVAELKIADSHFNLKEYEEATLAYKEFESLHPRNEAIPHVLYQIGSCYYKNIGSIDRDQEPARKSLDAFNKLIQQFPQNKYSKKAIKYRQKCMDSIAQQEFYVGLFYYKSKHYKAALYRFTTLLENYPNVKIYNEALKYKKLCQKALENLKSIQDKSGLFEK